MLYIYITNHKTSKNRVDCQFPVDLLIVTLDASKILHQLLILT